MGQLKKMKKKFRNSSKENIPGMLKVTWDDGYDQGAKDQRQSDINQVVSLLENLESIPGFGEKTAWKVRKLFMQQFGGEKVE